jgi:hypothetical protein
MAKVITTYLVEEDLKNEIRVLRAIENKNVSDFLKLLIYNYKKMKEGEKNG